MHNLNRPAPVLVSLWQIVCTHVFKCFQGNTDSTVDSRHSAALRKPVVAESHPTAAANSRLSTSFSSALSHQEQENTYLASHITPNSGRLVGQRRASSSRDSMGLATLPGSGTRLHGIPPVSLFSMQGAISATPVFAESAFACPASHLSPLAVAADSLHSIAQEGSNNTDAKAAAHSSPAKGSHMPTAADVTGKPHRARARKAAPAIPLAVKTRNQIAQDEHLRRMQLRSG